MDKEDISYMGLEDAVRDLERHGSSEDPIIYKKIEMIPEDLQWKMAVEDTGQYAKDIKISYYGGEKLHLIHGTLSGMVMDRRKLYATNTPMKMFIESNYGVICEHCGKRTAI